MANTTARVIRNTDLFSLYEKLLLKQELSLVEQSSLLQIAVILLNDEDPNAQTLGYRIIVLYSNHTSDYVPLYDVALNKGFIPITKLIESKENYIERLDSKFFSSFFSSLSVNYHSNGIYQSEEQLELTTFFEQHTLDDVAIVAPTSYGKSELFTKFCNSNTDKNICILVPTKALLAQTKRRLLEGLTIEDKRKIITHPEMHKSSGENIIAVLTQERLLRFIQKHSDFNFNYVFIDEAHNLLGKDQRSLLLAKVIILLKKKDANVTFKYLTPFLNNVQNISTKYTDFDIKEFKVQDSLKTEKFYIIDFTTDSTLKVYDQYFDEFSSIENIQCNDEIEFIKAIGANKNIVYLNTPQKVEKFIKNFIAVTEQINNPSIDRICKNITEFLHKDYLLIESLKKGIVYHHGSVPDIVKLYIESVYSEDNSIKNIVTTSTLLEGVNIPAQKLFILDIRKGIGNLTKSQFKNLVGRICRFKEIFAPNSGELNMLEPETYILKTQNYMAGNANLEKFIKKRTQVDLKITDKVENVLLENVIISEKNLQQKEETDECLENLAQGVTGEEANYAVTRIGQLCFLNNISEIDILLYEKEIESKANQFSQDQFTNSSDLLKGIAEIFIPYLKNDRRFDIYRRLTEQSAQNFYNMFLNWRMRNASYNEMINSFLAYWAEHKDQIVYVGRWGDISRDGSIWENWIDIKQKNRKERVNLAIVRIKEEQDYLDNFILKFIEVLNDLGKVEPDLYLNIRYGTTNKKKIALINSGVNSHLASLLMNEYADYVSVSPENNDVFIRNDVIEAMEIKEENDILIFETKFHIR